MIENERNELRKEIEELWKDSKKNTTWEIITESYFEERMDLDLKEKRKSTIKSLHNPIEDILKIKKIDTIKNQRSKRISSICELKDKRLVSCGDRCSIMVYDKSYKPQIRIQKAHDIFILSLCVLRNGELVSSSADKKIKVWKINQNDDQLTHTLITYSCCK